MPSDRELEDLLAAVLTTYVNEEPESGLSSRVLARTALEEPAPMRHWRWLATVPALAAILIVAMMLQRPAARRSVPAAVSNASAAYSAPPPAPQRATGPLTTAMPGPRRVLSGHVAGPRPLQHAEVKQARFPAHAPLTPAELSWFRFTTEQPGQAEEEVAIAERQREPLQTSPIRIDPVQIAPLGQQAIVDE